MYKNSYKWNTAHNMKHKNTDSYTNLERQRGTNEFLYKL